MIGTCGVSRSKPENFTFVLIGVLNFVLTIAVFTCSLAAVNDKEEYEVEGYDGWYNNKAHPDWGGAGEL